MPENTNTESYKLFQQFLDTASESELKNQLNRYKSQQQSKYDTGDKRILSERIFRIQQKLNEKGVDNVQANDDAILANSTFKQIKAKIDAAKNNPQQLQQISNNLVAQLKSMGANPHVDQNGNYTVEEQFKDSEIFKALEWFHKDRRQIGSFLHGTYGMTNKYDTMLDKATKAENKQMEKQMGNPLLTQQTLNDTSMSMFRAASTYGAEFSKALINVTLALIHGNLTQLNSQATICEQAFEKAESSGVLNDQDLRVVFDYNLYYFGQKATPNKLWTPQIQQHCYNEAIKIKKRYDIVSQRLGQGE